MRRWWILGLLPVMLLAKFLSVDEAFKPEAKLQGAAVELTIRMAPHIHLTKKALKIEIGPKGKIEPLPYTLPPAQKDEFGDEVYGGTFDVTIPFKRLDPAAKTVTLKVEYQGCSDRGVCYPPVTKRYRFDLPAAPSVAATKHQVQKPKSDAMSEEDAIASTLKHRSLGVVLLTFFGFGLLLALTPCIFPMIPILSSIIVAQGKGMSAKRAFWLSLIYVLSMALTYTFAGVLAGLFGANIQAALQNPWVITLFALLFVALALSMFGFYELQLPASWQSRLSRTSDEAGRRGGWLGVAVMGFLSALIVGPCVAPPLAGALIYIGQTGDALLGGAALFVMSLGMGLPLLLIGTGAGKFMPKPGGWMTIVSKVFGVVMLGVAIWMLSRILPATVTMMLWATLFIVSAVYMGALEPLGEKRSWNALWKGLGLMALLYGASLMIGALGGSHNPLKPFENFGSGVNKAASAKRLRFERVHSLNALQKILQTSDKPVMVDFRADWCVSCKELEENTFQNLDVIAALRNYRLVQVDVTANSPQEKKMMKHFGIYGPPAVLFFKNGKELRTKRISGYKSPEEFLKILNGA